jgi:hypothetical protein
LVWRAAHIETRRLAQKLSGEFPATSSSEIRTHGGKVRRLALFVSLMLCCIAHATQTGERELHWDALDVEAHLDADGVLDVIERHTMVFTGDWNGGERVFNIRARQKLEFLGLQRIDAKTGTLQALRETAVPSNVDDFSWADSRTLRWRSRLPSDAPFANVRLTYAIHYKLSGILLKEDEQYRIDHDFAFPDRPGPIERFTLNLDLDAVWQPLGKYQNRYTAGPIEPGKSFVVKIPLPYSGSLVMVPARHGGRETISPVNVAAGDRRCKSGGHVSISTADAGQCPRSRIPGTSRNRGTRSIRGCARIVASLVACAAT